MLLDELAEQTGLLHRIPNLGTHEKVLICDDEYFVTTSYNWLSFDGDSFADRYEHGVVHHGYEVATLREKVMLRLRPTVK